MNSNPLDSILVQLNLNSSRVRNRLDTNLLGFEFPWIRIRVDLLDSNWLGFEFNRFRLHLGFEFIWIRIHLDSNLSDSIGVKLD